MDGPRVVGGGRDVWFPGRAEPDESLLNVRAASWRAPRATARALWHWGVGLSSAFSLLGRVGSSVMVSGGVASVALVTHGTHIEFYF